MCITKQVEKLRLIIETDDEDLISPLINFASKVEVENILCFIEDDGSYEFIKLFEEKISDFSTSNIVSNDVR